MVEKKRFSDETTLVKSSELVGTTATLPSIDSLPTYLTQLELEILNLLLFWQTDLTPKYIENVIQTVYIFDRAETVLEKMDEAEIREAEGTNINQIEDTKISPFLIEFVRQFDSYKSESQFAPRDSIFAEQQIKDKYFTPDDKMPVEKKRLTLVTEINKIVPKPLAIPSHRAISNALLNLETQGYTRRKRVRTKTLWNVDPNLLQMRMERHRQIIDEFVKLKNKSKESTKEERERDAMTILLEKYSPALLELLGIEYWKYLTDKKPVSLVLRYMNDVKNLTRY